MHRFPFRHARVVLTLAALTACTKRDAPPADSAAAGANAPRSLVGSAASAKPAPGMPGALEKPLEQYTGAEFSALVKKLVYVGGHERERKCKDDPACDAKPAKKTRVLVDAVATQDSIAASNTPQFGVVYGRAQNKGNNVEARYGFLPAPQYEYYLVVTASPSGGMQWALAQLDTKANVLTQTGTGKFTTCNHPWVAGARADFKTCANSASGRDSVMRLGLLLQAIDDDPLWIACSAGCCTAES